MDTSIFISQQGVEILDFEIHSSHSTSYVHTASVRTVPETLLELGEGTKYYFLTLFNYSDSLEIT
jgi:hypothetical protein